MSKVSVVMPVYNRQSMVSEAIDSILKQDYGNFEFIIVNDGSTDSTAAILANYNDPRLRVVELPVNSGVSISRNIGMNCATGDYIAVMDSDDIAFPGRLTAQVSFMEAHPDVHILGTDAVKIVAGEEGRMNHPQEDAVIKSRLLAMDGSSMIHPTTMMRTGFLRMNSIQYPLSRTDSDHDLWIEAMAAGAKFHLLKQHLLTYRRHDTNITAETNTNLRRLHSDKLQYRIKLLGLFFPDLTHAEMTAIARLMESGRSLQITDACAGIAAANKAQKYTVSRYGESREVLSNLIRHFASAGIQALSAIGQRS
ncbi:hypothetical protein BOV90_05975 [Solemya velum gill symbiont]|uniref:Glycosyltransferase 2-like domain-containing protein n=1 Tax=Solemya velum gill symbiont TaxID=2340 RepID=A0A1T2DFU0_SOVGS|nr:glycosyltransferase family 2 protein [Solemya velum gill symbiont]OOY33976.1 hypothetical protein BOV88_12385 [Solemya velum gill symbiont]OOY36630.1 hypothetical protein BOV89_11520 [Solemya velum gill symbiont]OOY40077.1 hypothetical protein BOV90_05975 [Solemya velum gill symbiont]OOY45952.1 hypothetical protein BOV92_03980 [Solemya velum gill symbiont]OOY46053.1 hypothetical protein BOV93_11385 [Solemya velum gill symbiont]